MDKALIERIFDQSATPEDIRQLRAWLSQPGNEEIIAGYIQELWDERQVEEQPVPSFESMLEKAKIREREVGGALPLRLSRMYWMKIAAACLIFLVAGTVLGYIYRKQQPVADKWHLATAETGKGERAELRLSDGSVVLLEEQSTLFFPRQMDASAVVYLEGEASFRMADKARPVTIKTKEIVTKAKGSNLNISAIPSDSIVRVTVTEGKAEVSTNPEMFPMMKLRFPARDSTVTPVDTTKKVLPLVKLRPVVVKNNESIVYNKKSGTADISTAIEIESKN
ncbi:MAG: FecR family protein [Flavisolibacter sp.]